MVDRMGYGGNNFFFYGVFETEPRDVLERGFCRGRYYVHSRYLRRPTGIKPQFIVSEFVWKHLILDDHFVSFLISSMSEIFCRCMKKKNGISYSSQQLETTKEQTSYCCTSSIWGKNSI